MSTNAFKSEKSKTLYELPKSIPNAMRKCMSIQPVSRHDIEEGEN